MLSGYRYRTTVNLKARCDEAFPFGKVPPIRWAFWLILGEENAHFERKSKHEENVICWYT